MKSKMIDEMPPQKALKMVTAYLDERFGISAGDFADFGLYLGSKGRVYLGPKKVIERPKIVTLGLLVARISRSVKPSTNLLQLFGHRISKNLIILTKEQTVSYGRGEDVRLSADQICSEGYVLLKYKEFPLGCGFLQRGVVKNLLPKAKRLELKYV